MTQQPGQEDPYAVGAPGQPYGGGAYAAPGYPQAPAPGYAPAPAAGYVPGYVPGYGQPLPPLANWGKRLGAFLIDGLLTAVPCGLGAVLMSMSLEFVGYDMYGREVSQPTGAGVTALVLGYLAGFGLQLWNRWLRQGRTGQSVGKRVLGIRLVSERTMQPIGGAMAFVRDLSHLADGPFCLGYLWPLWDVKRQTFADKIVSTVVVDG